MTNQAISVHWTSYDDQSGHFSSLNVLWWPIRPFQFIERVMMTNQANSVYWTCYDDQSGHFSSLNVLWWPIRPSQFIEHLMVTNQAISVHWTSYGFQSGYFSSLNILLWPIRLFQSIEHLMVTNQAISSLNILWWQIRLFQFIEHLMVTNQAISVHWASYDDQSGLCSSSVRNSRVIEVFCCVLCCHVALWIFLWMYGLLSQNWVRSPPFSFHWTFHDEQSDNFSSMNMMWWSIKPFQFTNMFSLFDWLDIVLVFLISFLKIFKSLQNY